MRYITLSHLSNTIRHNLWKVPHDKKNIQMAKKMYTIGYAFHQIYGGGINYPYVRTAFLDNDAPLTERDVWNAYKKILRKELSDKLYNIDLIRLSLRNLYKRRSF